MEDLINRTFKESHFWLVLIKQQKRLSPLRVPERHLSVYILISS